MAGPLEGIRVIECGGYLSAPSACYMLGDLGAEVIKIEDRVKGDPTRGMSALFGSAMNVGGDLNIMFETANRNKKGITLDLKKEKGRQLLYDLVKTADVFCTNYTQSAIEKLNLDYETLSAYNPKLIYGLATGYGLAGPESKKRAFDTVAQARSGIMYATGEPESPPTQVAGPVFDQMTGTLLAYGILAALVAREKQGIGQQVEVSLLGSGLHLQAYNVNTVLMRGKPIPRHTRKNSRNAMANHYVCADGKWILFAEAQSDRFWHNFCETVGIENLEKDPRFDTARTRNKNRHELREILDELFVTRSRTEWVRLFEEKGSGLAFAAVNEPGELQTDPQIIENRYITKVDHPVIGPQDVIGCPVNFSKTPADVSGPAPAFGEHTELVLIDACNYSWEELEALRDEEII